MKVPWNDAVRRVRQATSPLQTKTQIRFQQLSLATQRIILPSIRRLIRNSHDRLKHLVAAFTEPRLRRIVLARWRRWRRLLFHIDQKALAPYTGLLLISAFVLVANRANLRAMAAPELSVGPVTDVAPEVVEEVLLALDPLTPEFEEDPTGVASTLVSFEDLYLSRPAATDMDAAEQESRKDPIPYVIAQGDTMVSIAKQHGRTVATILEANGIAPEAAWKLKVGTTLLIPQEDTSDSLAWLEAEQKQRAELAKKRAEQLAKKRAVVTTTRTVRDRAAAGYAGSFDGDFLVPIRHKGVSRGISRGHAGIDYRADMGTPVAAAAPGRVIETTRGWAGGFGVSVLIDHGAGVTTRYAHLSDSSVGVGETVDVGQVVGYSGSSGRSTGPHLHFETRVGGRAVNPF